MSSDGARPRIGLAGCFHETNTFASTVTDVAAFRASRGWYVGAELLDAYGGTRTVMGGMIDGAREHGFELVPVFGAFATPAGIVTKTAFEEISARLIEGLRAASHLDGVLLELHGAMVVEGDRDPETTLLTAIRETIGDLPLVAVTDLHANMTAERVALLDALVGYRTNPHVDTYESGADAAGHLSRLLNDGLETTLLHRAVPVIAAPIAQRSADLPLLRLLATAHEQQRRHRLLDVTVHAGYAFADVPHAGVSFTVTAPIDRTAQAEEVLDRLARQAWEHRSEFAVELPDARAAAEQAIALYRRHGRPIAVADTGDNINGGGPGDATWLLRAALEVAEAPVAGTLWDPRAVEIARAVGVGGTFDAELGGRAETLSGEPLRGPATVRWLGEGAFVNTGPMASGARVTMGLAAVVEIGRAHVILQSLPVQPNDPEMFRAVGLDPAQQALVLLKGAAAIRAGWAPIVSGFVDAGTPGVTDCDVRRLPYQSLHGVWPLDSGATLPPTTTEEMTR
ncbi:M81 family metallopeptidase [Egicoccus sp. AB-alg6-2]|uniref:M81 family metallopeptidase n=1 Tax=Egicoccus sp. AB-alg6-2 TaxID=3242692 RepID=UPI00359E6442